MRTTLTCLTIASLALFTLACTEGSLTTTSGAEAPTIDNTRNNAEGPTGPEIRIPRRGRPEVLIEDDLLFHAPDFRVAFRVDGELVTGAAIPYSVQLFQGELELTDSFGFTVELTPAADTMITERTVSFLRPGPYTVTVTARRGDDVVVDVTELTVGLGAAASMELTTSPDVVRAGELIYFEATVLDAVGNPLDPSTVGLDVWLEPTGAVLSLEPAELTLTEVGRYELHAETATGVSAINVFHVRPNDPQFIDLQIDPVEDLEPGDAIDFTVYAEDAYGNVIDTLEPYVYTVPRGGVVGARRVEFVVEGVYEVVAEVTGTPLVDREGPFIVDGAGPYISIKTPERGVALSGSSGIDVSISVYDPGSGLDRVDFNGETIELDERGDATIRMTAVEGVNLIDIDAWDAQGHHSNRNQSFMWGSYVSSGSTIWNSVIARINQGTIDMLEDWVEDAFDSSQIRSLVLANSRIYAGCIDLFFWEPCAYVDATNFTMSYLSVNLTPRDDGYIDLYAGIRRPNIRIEVSGSVSMGGNAKADWADLTARLRLWVDSSDNIRVSISNMNVNLRGFRLDNFLPDWLGFVEGWISDWVEGDVESAIQTAIADQAPALVDDALSELEISTSVDILGTSVTVEVVPNYFTTRSTGITLYFGTVVMADETDPDMDGAGVLRTWSAAPTYNTTPGFMLSLGDDFLNQALYALWESGSLNRLFADAVIPELDTTFIQALVPDADGLEFAIDPLLPPIFKPQLGWGSIGEFQMGDTMIDILATYPGGDTSLVARVAVSMFGRASVTIDAQNTVQIGFVGDPTFRFDGVFSAVPELTAEDLATLLDGLVPVLLPDLLDDVQEFPLPAFEGFTIGSPSVNLAGAEYDYINIRGNLVTQ